MTGIPEASADLTRSLPGFPKAEGIPLRLAITVLPVRR